MKHRDKCPHCAFMYAARNQYKSAKGKKDRRKAFDDMVTSAAKIAGMMLGRLNPEQKAAFMVDVIKASGDMATVEKVPTKGPTIN